MAELGAKQLFGKDRPEKDKVQGDFMLGRGTHDPGPNRNAYPMTDTVRYPSAVRVVVNGVAAGAFELPDDPADHRGLLSWHAQKRDGHLDEAGSYGYLVSATLPARGARARRGAGGRVPRAARGRRGAAGRARGVRRGLRPLSGRPEPGLRPQPVRPRRGGFAVAGLLLAAAVPGAGAPPETASIVIDAGRVEGHIDPRLYGHFLEFMYEGVKSGLRRSC